MTIAFRFFTAAYAAGSPASTGPVIFVDPVGESGKLFPSLADGNYGESLVYILVLKELDRLMHPFAPKFGSIEQFHLVLGDIGINGFLGLAAENQAVKPGPA